MLFWGVFFFFGSLLDQKYVGVCIPALAARVERRYLDGCFQPEQLHSGFCLRHANKLACLISSGCSLKSRKGPAELPFGVYEVSRRGDLQASKKADLYVASRRLLPRESCRNAGQLCRFASGRLCYREKSLIRSITSPVCHTALFPSFSFFYASSFIIFPPK